MKIKNDHMFVSNLSTHFIHFFCKFMEILLSAIRYKVEHFFIYIYTIFIYNNMLNILLFAWYKEVCMWLSAKRSWPCLHSIKVCLHHVIKMTHQHCYCIYHGLTPWNRVLLEKPRVTQLINKFPAFYGTQKFITVFISVHHWTLSWARWIIHSWS
jgi:hypothetical protein